MRLLTILLLLLLLCYSCSKEESGDYEPYIKGSIVGYAMLFDEYLYMMEDHSGIAVYTEPGRQYSGTTDITGKYEIKGVPTGTYNLSFEKDGFNTMKYLEVTHLGGAATVISPWSRVVIYPDITNSIINMTFQGDEVSVEVDYSGGNYMDYLSARLFFSTSDGFAIDEADYATNIRVYGAGVSFAELSDLPFESGATVYCKGCLFSKNEVAILFGNYHYADCIDFYYDDALGRTIYPNITEESDQYAFTMP